MADQRAYDLLECRLFTLWFEGRLKPAPSVESALKDIVRGIAPHPSPFQDYVALHETVQHTDDAELTRRYDATQRVLIIETELEREESERARICADYLRELQAAEAPLLKELANERFHG